jgi:hypothetical protein
MHVSFSVVVQQISMLRFLQNVKTSKSPSFGLWERNKKMVGGKVESPFTKDICNKGKLQVSCNKYAQSTWNVDAPVLTQFSPKVLAWRVPKG